ncbi:MAG: SMI1/KNR4 family protein [Streptococcaceae bacterium]|jgi:hypothetical protein|nr:SMI1/KNR4 family protein [Streptococcaceae bacterium]
MIKKQKKENKNVKWIRPYPVPVISIDTNIEGIFRYSPDFQNCPNEPYNLKASIIIKMQGSRSEDYAKAEEKGLIKHVSGITTWHHVWVKGTFNDECVMQLVSTRGHGGTRPHSGACKQYALKYNKPYGVISGNSANLGKITYSPNLKIPIYTKDAISEFERKVLSQYSLKIPPFLSNTYLTGKNFLEKGFTTPDIVINAEFDFYALLTEQESKDKISIEYILKENSKKEAVPPPTKTALPFGIDACGNLFYADLNAKNEPVVWFHDHEDYNANTMFIEFR